MTRHGSRRLVLVPLLVSALLAAPGPSYSASDSAARTKAEPSVTRRGFDADPRLDQPVEIEIMGRSAISSLRMLSEMTRVSLQVDPKSITTTGERKLSIFARGCSLKEIMRLIPEALQECYWSIDRSGPQPVYLLRRKPLIDQEMAALAEQARSRRAEEVRQERIARIEAARQGLQLSEQQIVELEKSDLFLARSLRHPETRALMEMFFSLPPDMVQQFLNTGSISMNYADAPEALRQAAARIMDRTTYAQERSDSQAPPEGAKRWRDYLQSATLFLSDGEAFGMTFSIKVPTPGGPVYGSQVAFLPRCPTIDESAGELTRLLVETGTQESSASRQVFDECMACLRKENTAEREKRRAGWVEPTDPDLLQTVALGNESFSDFAQILKAISGKTGLSVVSDYFTNIRPRLPDEARRPLPLWRLLHSLCEASPYESRRWRKAGNCLMLYCGNWYRLAASEIPESLLTRYREKLRAQGRFTLNDLAALATALGSRRARYSAVPEDLARAGATSVASDRDPLLLCASLTQDQAAKARRPEGLPAAEMTDAQRTLMAEAVSMHSDSPLPGPDRLAQGTFRIKETKSESHAGKVVAATLCFGLPREPDYCCTEIRLPQVAVEPGGAQAPPR